MAAAPPTRLPPKRRASASAGGTITPTAAACGEPCVRRGRGRPPVISTEKLLDVARSVFLERGIRATTAEVAERAGIAEGTVFHRFPSKDALFRAAMRFDPEEVPRAFECLFGNPGQGDLRQRLVDVATRMLEMGRVSLPVMMMSWSNPASEYALEKMPTHDGYRRIFGAVKAFFEGEIRAGRIAMMDPELPARILVGSLHHYLMTGVFYAHANDTRMSSDTFVHALIDFLLRAAGTAAPADEQPDPRRPRRARTRSRPTRL